MKVGRDLFIRFGTLSEFDEICKSGTFGFPGKFIFKDSVPNGVML